ncbi:MAG: glycosyltransferase [Candidatus Saccharibacteria bacterium]|nr:glycosyltransferase [Candidatus Saccharibacteria bacterium]
MRIGLFTDTYRPAQNGVVVVIDVTRRELEAMGHEVYVFAPSANLRNQVAETDKDDDHLIHFPTIRGAGFKEGQLSVFLPTVLLSKVRDLKIDVLHFFTAGQMAMFCCYAARKTGAALIGQHCTDTYEYSDNYRLLKIGYAAMSPLMTAAVDMTTKQKLNFATFYALKKGDDNWGKRLVSAMIAMWYQACDITVAVSEKSAHQLEKIAADNDTKFNMYVLPTGVNPPVAVTDKQIKDFRQKFDIAEDDEVIINYGRLGQEKNLAMLIPAFEKVLEKRPKAKLVYAGDWEYRAELEKLAQQSSAADRIVFVGRYQRDQIGILNAISKLYLFPSLTDTQGLVVTEAAHGGLPIILCDPLAPAAFEENGNGLVAKDDPDDFADKIIELLSNKDKYKKFSQRSRELAAELTERAQTEKLVELYRKALRGK